MLPLESIHPPTEQAKQSCTATAAFSFGCNRAKGVESRTRTERGYHPEDADTLEAILFWLHVFLCQWNLFPFHGCISTVMTRLKLPSHQTQDTIKQDRSNQEQKDRKTPIGNTVQHDRSALDPAHSSPTLASLSCSQSTATYVLYAGQLEFLFISFHFLVGPLSPFLCSSN